MLKPIVNTSVAVIDSIIPYSKLSLLYQYNSLEFRKVFSCKETYQPSPGALTVGV